MEAQKLERYKKIFRVDPEGNKIRMILRKEIENGENIAELFQSVIEYDFFMAATILLDIENCLRIEESKKLREAIRLQGISVVANHSTSVIEKTRFYVSLIITAVLLRDEMMLGKYAEYVVNEFSIVQRRRIFRDSLIKLWEQGISNEEPLEDVFFIIQVIENYFSDLNMAHLIKAMDMRQIVAETDMSKYKNRIKQLVKRLFYNKYYYSLSYILYRFECFSNVLEFLECEREYYLEVLYRDKSAAAIFLWYQEMLPDDNIDIKKLKSVLSLNTSGAYYATWQKILNYIEVTSRTDVAVFKIMSEIPIFEPKEDYGIDMGSMDWLFINAFHGVCRRQEDVYLFCKSAEKVNPFMKEQRREIFNNNVFSQNYECVYTYLKEKYKEVDKFCYVMEKSYLSYYISYYEYSSYVLNFFGIEGKRIISSYSHYGYLYRRGAYSYIVPFCKGENRERLYIVKEERTLVENGSSRIPVTFHFASYSKDKKRIYVKNIKFINMSFSS